VLFVSGLLHAERQRRGTRAGTRALAASSRPCWSSGGSWTAPAWRSWPVTTRSASPPRTTTSRKASTCTPLRRVDLWWSGKHHNHGGNVQVISAPDGWPIWTSEVRPGREHDTTAVRTHTEILPALTEVIDDLRPLGDLGYEGESDTITVAFKKPKDGQLTGSSSTRLTTVCGQSASGPTPC
jgi:hypothetical protein